MNFENELSLLYKEIAEQVSCMIPTKWDKFYFHGELREGEGEVYFFYTVPGKPEDFLYCYYIPETYNVDRDIYNQLENELFELLVKLQDVFKRNVENIWYSFTMILEESGKMNADFSYTKWNLSKFGPSDRKDYFQYKYLKTVPKTDFDEKLMLEMEEFEKSHS
ncbi:immunity protein YezG family protein [Carnobacterium maltaromaticum]|uniref:immunity protein YezG family protein n=1 Tax=Carnobacterium maltaromaticum TaxID=2751 RepID=UPI0039BE119B